MNLSLVAVRDGKQVNFAVGDRLYVDHLRAVMVLLFVATAWRMSGIDGDALQGLLSWVNLGKYGPDPLETTITEKDLVRLLRGGNPLQIHYDMLPDSPFEIGSLPWGTRVGDAAVGLWKFMRPSRCVGDCSSGYFSSGDVADIDRLFAFIEDSPIAVDDEIAKTIADFSAELRIAAEDRKCVAGMDQFFRDATENWATVVFA